MVNQSNFVVRISGKRANSCYIDYSGIYDVTEIAKLSGLNAQTIVDKYISFGAIQDKENNVYYFSNTEDAKNAVSAIIADMPDDIKGIPVILTLSEIEYIRKALINEGSQVIHVKNSIIDSIFKKLNG